MKKRKLGRFVRHYFVFEVTFIKYLFKMLFLKDASHNMFVKLEVLKQAKGNIYEAHKKFVLSFDESWRSDDNIMLILCAITLFCPTRSHVVHSDLIK